MADRRCLHKKITESDDFYALSSSAQALYMHLNQNADDDGFINNAKSISLKIRNGNNALAELVKRRFVLQFGGVYVVKHWRVSNSLKNDRLKPLNYPGLASKIWIKENRSYTDHFLDGCKTLFEVKMESVWNPLGILTEPNRTADEGTSLVFRGVWGRAADKLPFLRYWMRGDAVKIGLIDFSGSGGLQGGVTS